jgi:LysM repeat protein
MKKHGYNVLLLFLRGLIYSKRAFLWFGLLLYGGFEKIVVSSWRLIGVRFYKVFFIIQKQLGWIKNPWQNQIAEIVSRRGTLQIFLFIICFFVLFPHTKLYARDSFKIPGRDTPLFSLVGPGEEDFALQEVVFNGNVVSTKDVVSWRGTAVSADNTGVSGNNNIISDIAGISAGGLALTKPTIIPGSTLPTQGGANETGRMEIVEYEVKPGDVIGKIASDFGISVETILWANNLTIRSYIRPGNKLIILPVTGISHQVKKGENVSKIARLYGVSQDEIIKTNRLQRDGSDISIGEKLIIPGGRAPEAVRAPIVTPSRTNAFRQVAAPPSSIETPAGSGYLWPAGVRHISQYYGWRHTGLDIAGPIGTPIYAARSGRVLIAKGGWNGGYGNYIVIDHGGGIQTAYGHSSQINVVVGQDVVQGQVISLMGSTGRSTGPHLHFEVRISGARLNPLKYIR